MESAQAALEYSTRNRELAELEILKYGDFKSDNYTTVSYAALTDAKNTIDTLAAQDKAAETGEGERVNPERFIEARTAFSAAVDGLVDVTGLKSMIDEADKVDGSLYTEESYQALVSAVEKGKALLENGTEDAVTAAITEISEKLAALDPKPDVTLDEVIAEAEAILNAEGAEEKYTADSYDALADIVAEAKQNEDESRDDSYIEKIRTAVNELVNVTALRAQIAAAENVDKDLYTVSSYKVLVDLLGQTETLLKSGSREDIAAAAEAIDHAIRSLVPRAEGVEDYRDSITLKPGDGYTDESYKAYKEAYEALMNIDPSDLSAEEFARLKEDFEKAELGLKAAGGSGTGQADSGQDKADKPGENGKNDQAVQTGDDTNILPVVIVLLICVAAVVAVIIIRKKRK